MSVKFERDTYKQTEGVAGPAVSAAAELLGRDGPIPGTTGKHPISEAVGTALTGGKQMAGTKGYLMVRHHYGLVSRALPYYEVTLVNTQATTTTCCRCIG